jgi:hypothetical protein
MSKDLIRYTDKGYNDLFQHLKTFKQPDFNTMLELIHTDSLELLYLDYLFLYSGLCINELIDIVQFIVSKKGEQFIKKLTTAKKYIHNIDTNFLLPEYYIILPYILDVKKEYCNICYTYGVPIVFKCSHSCCSVCHVQYRDKCHLCRKMKY